MKWTNLKLNKKDSIASLVVFIVAIPLSLGIALASGTSAYSGLVAAIIGGIVVGILSGAPLMVSGPAAGLTVLVYQIVQDVGIIGLAYATICCGLFQVLLSYFKTGKLFTLIPRTVLEGMLAAIGLIILLGQLHVMMGFAVPKSPVQALLTLPQSLQNTFTEYGVLSPVLFCGLLGIFIQLLWPKFFKKSWIPGALPAVLIVTLLSLFWNMPRLEISSLLPQIKASLTSLTSHPNTLSLLNILSLGLGLAIVASAESLLTARAVDLLAQKENIKHQSDLNKEMKAQGFGNIISGILGGLPVTGVIVRSSANIQAGALTRQSTILHGLWVFIFLVFFPFLINKIPLTALAAILVVTGIKLLNLKHLLALLKTEPIPASQWLITLFAILITDLLTGLIIGITYSFLVYVIQEKPSPQHLFSRLVPEKIRKDS